MTNPAAPIEAATLHQQIMNLPCKQLSVEELANDRQLLYKLGHRDARHAAAELVLASSPPAAATVPEEAEVSRDFMVPSDNEILRRAAKHADATVHNRQRAIMGWNFSREGLTALCRELVSTTASDQPSTEQRWESHIAMEHAARAALSTPTEGGELPVAYLRLEADDNESASHVAYKTPVEGSFPVYARPTPAAAAGVPPIPDVLFDGYAVLSAMDDRAKTRTSAENVSDVLDAVVRLLRSGAPAGAPTKGEQQP